MTVDDFLRVYRYRADKRDKWAILSAPPFEGDCEDFALTVLWLLCGKSKRMMAWWVATGKACMWHTKAGDGPLDGHAMLWVRGMGWIDCNHPKWGARQYQLIMPYILPLYLTAWLIKGA